MITFNGISKRFGKLQVLDDVHLTCKKGECIALIGPNACGKTTLIKTLLGMVLQDKGTVLYNGQDTQNQVLYRQHIGYMPQIGRYPQNMTIGQVINMIKDIRKSSVQYDEDLMSAFSLPSMWNKQMGALSGGTTQKVSATLAFLFQPETLILDEPTAGLDPIAAEILKEKIIQEKKNGKLTLITSHMLSELDDLITEIVFMQDGKIAFHKPVDQIRNETGEEKISKAIAGILKKRVS